MNLNFKVFPSHLVPFFFPKAPPKKDTEEKPEEHKTKETDGAPSGPGPRQQPSALCARGSKKATRSPQRSTSKIKENKHPFALYGWGERQMDMGSQKTHNVCASASVHEVWLERGQTSPELPWGHFSYGYGAQRHWKSLGYVGVHGSQKKGSLVLERWSGLWLTGATARAKV